MEFIESLFVIPSNTGEKKKDKRANKMTKTKKQKRATHRRRIPRTINKTNRSWSHVKFTSGKTGICVQKRLKLAERSYINARPTRKELIEKMKQKKTHMPAQMLDAWILQLQNEKRLRNLRNLEKTWEQQVFLEQCKWWDQRLKHLEATENQNIFEHWFKCSENEPAKRPIGGGRGNHFKKKNKQDDPDWTPQNEKRQKRKKVNNSRTKKNKRNKKIQKNKRRAKGGFDVWSATEWPTETQLKEDHLHDVGVAVAACCMMSGNYEDERIKPKNIALNVHKSEILQNWEEVNLL